MASGDLDRVASTLVADGRGILAADETVLTLTRRFETLGIRSTEQSRRTYREMLFTSPGAAKFISGVIMYDETIRQRSSRGMPLAEALPDSKPWKISFSYGRALQDPALEAWHGRDENLAAGQSALCRRAICNGTASVGNYTQDMELEPARA
jgi:fructose-bisphosphate aldolase class 1